MTKEISIGNILTRDAMKNLKGGLKTHTYTVTCTTLPGYTMTEPGSCTGGASACQTASYNYCQSTPGCQACTASY